MDSANKEPNAECRDCLGCGMATGPIRPCERCWPVCMDCEEEWTADWHTTCGLCLAEQAKGRAA